MKNVVRWKGLFSFVLWGFFCVYLSASDSDVGLISMKGLEHETLGLPKKGKRLRGIKKETLCEKGSEDEEVDYDSISRRRSRLLTKKSNLLTKRNNLLIRKENLLIKKENLEKERLYLLEKLTVLKKKETSDSSRSGFEVASLTGKVNELVFFLTGIDLAKSKEG